MSLEKVLLNDPVVKKWEEEYGMSAKEALNILRKAKLFPRERFTPGDILYLLHHVMENREKLPKESGSLSLLESIALYKSGRRVDKKGESSFFPHPYSEFTDYGKLQINPHAKRMVDYRGTPRLPDYRYNAIIKIWQFSDGKPLNNWLLQLNEDFVRELEKRGVDLEALAEPCTYVWDVPIDKIESAVGEFKSLSKKVNWIPFYEQTIYSFFGKRSEDKMIGGEYSSCLATGPRKLWPKIRDLHQSALRGNKEAALEVLNIVRGSLKQTGREVLKRAKEVLEYTGGIIEGTIQVKVDIEMGKKLHSYPFQRDPNEDFFWGDVVGICAAVVSNWGRLGDNSINYFLDPAIILFPIKYGDLPLGCVYAHIGETRGNKIALIVDSVEVPSSTVRSPESDLVWKVLTPYEDLPYFLMRTLESSAVKAGIDYLACGQARGRYGEVLANSIGKWKNLKLISVQTLASAARVAKALKAIGIPPQGDLGTSIYLDVRLGEIWSIDLS